MASGSAAKQRECHSEMAVGRDHGVPVDLAISRPVISTEAEWTRIRRPQACACCSMAGCAQIAVHANLPVSVYIDGWTFAWPRLGPRWPVTCLHSSAHCPGESACPSPTFGTLPGGSPALPYKQSGPSCGPAHRLLQMPRLLTGIEYMRWIDQMEHCKAAGGPILFGCPMLRFDSTAFLGSKPESRSPSSFYLYSSRFSVPKERVAVTTFFLHFFFVLRAFSGLVVFVLLDPSFLFPPSGRRQLPSLP